MDGPATLGAGVRPGDRIFAAALNPDSCAKVRLQKTDNNNSATAVLFLCRLYRSWTARRNGWRDFFLERPQMTWQWMALSCTEETISRVRDLEFSHW